MTAPSTPSHPPLTQPESFGHYRLEQLRGRGGMGEVFRAVDTRKNRVVALKRLHADLVGDGEYQRRFRRESELTARLSDPHVIPIHDYGEIDGRLFLDMRYVEGADLSEVLEAEGQLSGRDAVGVVEQIADALDDAHRNGLLHRDVKPSNILLTPSRFAYLVDFGIAKSVDVGDTSLTRTGTAPGSLAYMAPERFSGAGDARADVYALACVLYECLTGHKAFGGSSLPEVVYAHLHAMPRSLREDRPDLPAALDDVIRIGLSKDVDRRFPTAGALARAARAALTRTDSAITRTAAALDEHPGSAEPPTSPVPAQTVPASRRRTRILLGGAGVAVLLVLAVLAGALWAGRGTGAGTPPPAAAAAGIAAVAAPPYYLDAPVTSMAVSPDGTRAYLTDNGNSATGGGPNIYVFDPAGEVVTSLIFFSELDDAIDSIEHVAVAAEPGLVYIEGRDSDTTWSSRVYVIDIATQAIVNDYPVGQSSNAFAVSPDGRLTYHAAGDSGALIAHDTATGRQVAEIPTGGYPYSMTLSPDGTRAWLLSTDDVDGRLQAIDLTAGTVTGSTPVGWISLDAAPQLSPDGTLLYVPLGDGLLVVDTATLTPLRHIPVAEVTGLAVTSDGRHAVVVKGTYRQLAVIDLTTDVVTDLDGFETDEAPSMILLTPDARRAYVASAILPRLAVAEFTGTW